MDYHVFKSMLNRFYAPYIGGQQRPVFFDINATFPELNIVTQNYSNIKNEYAALS